ncbi:MAG: phosphatase PAP2 family protein [Candidatus Levybacteria bacterium]|nr:phosphatase PAP2 family protein [Candidatus Levybacteria bacterium]
MTKRIAGIISLIANPFLLIVPVPYLLVYRVTYDNIYALYWTAVSIIFLIIVGLFIIYAVKKGVFSDFDVSHREQRSLLFITIGIASILYLVVLVIGHGPQVLYLAILGFLLSIIAIAVINTRIKASIHTATITALIVLFWFLYDMNLVLILFVPLVAWSRITVNRHTISEVVAGSIIGGGLTLFLYLLVRIALKLFV